MRLVTSTALVDTKADSEDSASRQRLIKAREGLEPLLQRDNPGEWVWWWVAADAIELPEHTIAALRRAGPALTAFFAAANDLFYRDEAIQRRLEKSISPLYAKLNRAQPEDLPLMPRPDIVLDANLAPKLVEFEITACARSDTTTMSEFYGTPEEHRLVRHYVDYFNRCWPGKRLAVLAAPHPFWSDLADDANGFVSKLKREGLDVVLITGDELPLLRFDGQHLVLCGEVDLPIDVVDRLIDIYELAEWAHPGMAPIVDAYLDGAIATVNTFKQFLDEKEWMALFWDDSLRAYWEEALGEHDAVLRDMSPRTWRMTPALRIELADGRRVSLEQLADLPPEQRQFVSKESGTSTTSSGAQSVEVLSDLTSEEVRALIAKRTSPDTPYVLQEIVESARIDFEALNPNGNIVVRQSGARVKMSAFYVDSELTDIKFIASNRQFTVNDSQCLECVVRRRDT